MEVTPELARAYRVWLTVREAQGPRLLWAMCERGPLWAGERERERDGGLVREGHVGRGPLWRGLEGHWERARARGGAAHLEEEKGGALEDGPR